MARRPRLVIPGYPHHVVIRGNNKNAVFFSDKDRLFFIDCLRKAKDKDKKRAELVAEYREQFANPYIAAGLGYIDKVIYPHETRQLICKGLDMLASKRQSRPPKKHGNIPL